MNLSRVKKVIAFCTEIKITRKPQTYEEWKFCKKAHGDSFNTFSVKEFKVISDALDASINITNTERTASAFFINLKNHFSQ